MAGRIQLESYRIDVRRLARAKRALRTRTETETIHRALDLAGNEVALAKALRALIASGRGHVERLQDDLPRGSAPSPRPRQVGGSFRARPSG